MESVQLVLKLEDQLSGKLKKISRDSTRLEQAVIRVQNQAVRLQQKAKQMGDTLGNAFNRARRGADGLVKKLNGVKGLVVGLGAGAATKGFIEQAASFEQTQLRLELLSRQYGEFDQVQKLVRKNATTFNQSLGESSSNFANIFARLRPLGKSLSEIQTVYQGFNAVALASGTSAQAASSAFLQLSQALGSGRLQGDEFRSISEQIPGILTLVSQEMGVTVGELKKLGSEGKITSDILINSLAKGFELNKDKIQELLAESPAAKFKEFKNRVDELQVSIGQTLLPAAEGAVSVLGGLLDIVQKLPPELQALLNAAVGVGGALAAAAAAANLLGISLTSAKIKAGFLAFGKFALLAGPILGVTLALEDARRKFKEFSDLIKTGTVDELETAIETTDGNLKKMEKTLAAIEGAGYYKGQASDAAGLRDRISEAVDQLDRLRARKDVLSQTFTIAGIKYDANMVPIDPPETVSQRLAREEAERKRKEEEEKKKPKPSIVDPLAGIKGQVQGLRDRAKISRQETEEGKRQQQLLNDIAALTRIRTEENAHLVDEAIKLTGEIFHQETKTRQAAKADKDRADAATAALKAQQAEADRLERLYGGIGQTISSGIVDSLMQAQNATQALGNMLQSVAKQIMQLGVNTLLKAAFPGAGLFSGLLGFANGGRPPVGRPSIVGERGPELFVPDRAGTIVPNSAMGGASVTVNVDASGSSVEGNSDQASQLGRMLGAAVQAELIKQKRPGGLLAS
jgi:tape measure domain-containing protein|tara:strand:- start:1385 stop:3616 length:2232 start_codon:yes stop_codon:yes gene_type:complete